VCVVSSCWFCVLLADDSSKQEEWNATPAQAQYLERLAVQRQRRARVRPLVRRSAGLGAELAALPVLACYTYTRACLPSHHGWLVGGGGLLHVQIDLYAQLRSAGTRSSAEGNNVNVHDTTLHVVPPHVRGSRNGNASPALGDVSSPSARRRMNDPTTRPIKIVRAPPEERRPMGRALNVRRLEESPWDL